MFSLTLLSTALAFPAQDPEPPDNDGDGYYTFDDCDDEDATVYPGAPDVCDGKDNDCDGSIDETDGGVVLLHPDADGDGFGNYGWVEVTDPALCPLEAGYAVLGNDCDDLDSSIHPGAVDDQCDGVDDNCDYRPDDQDPTAGTWYYDVDGDGRAGNGGGFGCSQPGATGVYADCNESDPTVYVGATEVFGDGIDQDCNGIDEPWPDQDLDGYDVRDDCDDLSVSVNPGADEACGNSVDDDCDGSIDEGCSTEPPDDRKGCSTLGAAGLLPWTLWLGFRVRRG